MFIGCCWFQTFDCNCFWASITAFGTIMLAILTLCLVIIGKIQLDKLNNTSKENFLHKIKMDFFTVEARRIMFFIDYKLLNFNLYKLNPISESNDELAVFEIKKIENELVTNTLLDTINLETEKLNKDKKAFTSYEMDDFLLSNLEDLGFLYRKKLIDIHNIDQLFGYYIVNIFENSTIKEYIEWTRKDDQDIYSNFEYMYNELKLYQNKN